MKKFTKLSILFASFAMAMGVGLVGGAKEVRADSELEQSYDLTNAVPSGLTASTSLTKDSNSRGMGKAGATYTLTTSDSFTNVVKIVVNAATNYSTYSSHSVSVTVGGTALGSSQSFTAKASTDYTMGSDDYSTPLTGAVVVTLTNGKSGTTKSNTIWCKTISIYTSSDTSSHTFTDLTVNPTSISVYEGDVLPELTSATITKDGVSTSYTNYEVALGTGNTDATFEKTADVTLGTTLATAEMDGKYIQVKAKDAKDTSAENKEYATAYIAVEVNEKEDLPAGTYQVTLTASDLSDVIGNGSSNANDAVKSFEILEETGKLYKNFALNITKGYIYTKSSTNYISFVKNTGVYELVNNSNASVTTLTITCSDANKPTVKVGSTTIDGSTTNYVSTYNIDSSAFALYAPNAYVNIVSIAIEFKVLDATQPNVAITSEISRLAKGESTTLEAETTNASGATVVWSVDDESIATIDQTGKLTGVEKGDVEVTAKITVGGTDYTATKTIRITVPAAIERVSIASLISKTSSDSKVVEVVGKVSNMVNTSYGNFDLVDLDDSTVTVYVYGATANASRLVKTDTGLGYYEGAWSSGSYFNSAAAEGDIVTMEVVYVYYNGTPEIQGVITNVYTANQQAADAFMTKWDNLGDICEAIASNREGVKELIAEYQGLDADVKAIVDAAELDDTTYGRRIEYATNNIEYVESQEANGAKVVVASSTVKESTPIIAIVAGLMLTSVAGYFFLNKKRLSK